MVFGLSYRSFILTCVIIGSLYWFTRLYNLTSIPIFTDEAIYLRWSQIGSRDPNWRFISLTDGKQPLFTWFVMLFMRFIADPLTAGRLVSVCAGFLTLISTSLLAHELFSRKSVILVSSLLYIFSPFAIMYDRLALYDSLVASLYISSLYLSIRLIRTLRFDTAMLLGISLGLGMLNKSSGFLSLYLQPTLLLIYKRVKTRKYSLLVWLLYVAVAGSLAFAMYSILRLSPFFAMISQKDAVFIYGLREIVHLPFARIIGNFSGLFDWLKGYMTVPLFAASLLSLLLGKNYLREKILLICWWLFPFCALAVFGKVLYPRFILFMTVPLLILAADFIVRLGGILGKTLFSAAVLSAIVFLSVRSVFYIITDPVYAPIPFADRGQLISDWPSGWGINEVNRILTEKSHGGKVTVYTEGTFGLLPYALEIYLIDNPNISIHGLWPVKGAVPGEVLESAKHNATYMVLNESQVPPDGWPMDLVSEYNKGNNPDSKLRLYRMKNTGS